MSATPSAAPASPPSSGIPKIYIERAVNELQISYGISHVSILSPALTTTLATSQSVRAVLLVGDMLLSRMPQAFMGISRETQDFPRDLAALYLHGRQTQRTKDDIRAEIAGIDTEKFRVDGEIAQEWLEALQEAESIVARIRSRVDEILAGARVSIVEFASKYDQQSTQELVLFINRFRSMRNDLVVRAQAFKLVEELASKDTTISRLGTSAKLSLAMSMVELRQVYAAEIMDNSVQGKSAISFVHAKREEEIRMFRDGLERKAMNPQTIFPGTELNHAQACQLFDCLFRWESRPIPGDDHALDYQQAVGRLAYCARTGVSFGATQQARETIARAISENFTKARYRHIMGQFGYRIAYRGEAA